MPGPVAALIDRVLFGLIMLVLAEALVANYIAFGGRLSPNNRYVRVLRRLVDPLLAPIRRVLPPHRLGGWDLSPVVLTLFLYLIRIVLQQMR